MDNLSKIWKEAKLYGEEILIWKIFGWKPAWNMASQNLLFFYGYQNSPIVCCFKFLAVCKLFQSSRTAETCKSWIIRRQFFCYFIILRIIKC